MVYIFLADGFEEIEALCPVDVLRRAGVECDLVSVNGITPIGSHGITVTADKTVEQVDFSDYDGIVVPGGMPGAVNISACQKVVLAISEMLEKEMLVCAICASPAVVLADNGLLKVEKATCYPATQFVNSLGAKYTASDVEVSGNVITANGPKSAMAFSIAICNYLGVSPKF